MRHLIRYRCPIVCILVAAIGLPVLYDRIVARVAIGGFMYEVRVVSSVSIREVRYKSFRTLDWAEEALHFKQIDRRDPVSPVEWDGDRFGADVTFYDRESGMGWRYSYIQDRFLAVVALLADGRRVTKIVELPDARGSREVTIQLD
ncbi:MAG TPA: hypothetical protein VH092_17190 [Urbifossiella sp.]|jgi:hypothetical protein|nr:hypothetical protein [Urbifossiella sp.]